MNWQSIIHFWFEEITPSQWFIASSQFDSQIESRFGKIWNQARQCELWTWREEPLGRLAEIIVLDQFSRNIKRGTQLAFSQDAMALSLAQEAIERGTQRNFTLQQKAFLYMPFMHSESLVMQKKAIELFSEPGLETNLDFSIQHKKIIERFGRFPHRNQILGRESTAEEIAFLRTPGSSF